MDQNGDNVMSEESKTAHGEEIYSNYFSTPFYATSIDSWTDKLNKHCQPWLDDAHNTYKKEAPERKSDFGFVYHSRDISTDPYLHFFTTWILNTATNLLSGWGADLSNYTVLFESMWVQEFPKDGGGHHRIHIHENCHVSGFFFLQNDNASYPLFHDPRPGTAMTALPEKNENNLTDFTKTINYQPQPGACYMFPSYFPHEYVVSKGGNFRFIHWNITAVKNKHIGAGFGI